MQNFSKWCFNTFFGSIFNTFITLLSLVIFFFFINSVIGFISTSEWEVVKVNRRLLLIGRMPPEHEYRVWPILWITSYLIMASIRTWGSPSYKDLIFISLGITIVCIIFTTSSTYMWVLTSILVCIFAYVTTSFIVKNDAANNTNKKKLI